MIRRHIRRKIQRLAAAAAELPALLLGASARGGNPQMRLVKVKAKVNPQSRLSRRQGAGKWATD